MAGAIDRRAARTRRTLHEALMALILRKGYDAITVQDLIDAADVGRSTFYAHYAGKEDLLRSGFARLRAELEEARRAARGEGRQDAPLGFSRALFEHAAGYADVYRALVGGRGGAVALNEIRRILTEIVKQDMTDARDDGPVPHAVRVAFVVGTFLTVLAWWLERSPRLPPPRVDAIFRRLALAGIGPSVEAEPGLA